MITELQQPFIASAMFLSAGLTMLPGLYRHILEWDGPGPTPPELATHLAAGASAYTVAEWGEIIQRVVAEKHLVLAGCPPRLELPISCGDRLINQLWAREISCPYPCNLENISYDTYQIKAYMAGLWVRPYKHLNHEWREWYAVWTPPDLAAQAQLELIKHVRAAKHPRRPIPMRPHTAARVVLEIKNSMTDQDTDEILYTEAQTLCYLTCGDGSRLPDVLDATTEIVADEARTHVRCVS